MKRLVATVARVGDFVRARYAICLTCSSGKDEQVLASTGCMSKHHLIGEHPDTLPPFALRKFDSTEERA